MAYLERVLFIDQHDEWLAFAQDVLSDHYDVVTSPSFEEALTSCLARGKLPEFDLVFIGLNLARDHLPAISEFAEAASNGWHFVVMFPIFQEDEVLRTFFKAGVFDCADKPYERQALLKLVAEEMLLAKHLRGMRKFVRLRKARVEI